MAVLLHHNPSICYFVAADKLFTEISDGTFCEIDIVVCWDELGDKAADNQVVWKDHKTNNLESRANNEALGRWRRALPAARTYITSH